MAEWGRGAGRRPVTQPYEKQRWGSDTSAKINQRSAGRGNFSLGSNVSQNLSDTRTAPRPPDGHGEIPRDQSGMRAIKGDRNPLGFRLRKEEWCGGLEGPSGEDSLSWCWDAGGTVSPVSLFGDAQPCLRRGQDCGVTVGRTGRMGTMPCGRTKGDGKERVGRK